MILDVSSAVRFHHCGGLRGYLSEVVQWVLPGDGDLVVIRLLSESFRWLLMRRVQFSYLDVTVRVLITPTLEL